MKVKQYVWPVVLIELLGIIGGGLIRNGIERFALHPKLPLSPPAILFPIVWTILYALMGVGMARIRMKARGKWRNYGLSLFWLQLFFNLMWGIIFFNKMAYAAAFIWLLIMWVIILVMIIVWRKEDKVAAWLQIPYILWVSFAAYLNYSVWMAG